MNISNSIRKLTRLFIILFVILSVLLVYWQVVVANQVTANIHNGRHCLSDAAPIRGRIFDRNGVLLADSEPISANNPNAGNLCGYQRHYFLSKYPSLAALIGYYISPLYPATGVEAAYNNYLNGQVGLTSLSNTMNQTLHLPPVGDDIYLTIDTRIQARVEYSYDHDIPLPDNEFVFKSNGGAVVVTDPHTGEILAMLSRPFFDSNRVASGDTAYVDSLQTAPGQPLLEHATQLTYVPGSIYKTVTLAAGLDSGSSTLNDLFYDNHQPGVPQAIGPIVLGSGDETETFGPAGNNITGFTFRFPVNLEYGYTHSDNVIFAQEGVKMGAKTWLDYNNRFYVGKPIPFDGLPVVASSVTPRDGSPLKVNQLGENAFGQGIDAVTPLQMSLIDNTVANDGTMMRPMLVMKIEQPDNPNTPTNTNGTVIQSFSPQVLGTPISSQTASTIRDAMNSVVRCGSGHYISAHSPLDPMTWRSPYEIIGKTGTGQVGASQNVGAQAWMITQAPYTDSAHRLTIVGLSVNAGEGGAVIGPIANDVFNYIFSTIPEWKIAPPQSSDPGVLANQDSQFCLSNGMLQA
ncbi:MAG TPA: penicillin-binding transpeptidase domain-containing protein [Ktedonobacteraceae bacterium]|nr:penicillin-binding transpeptidase domain-containing protein [Ktedonobacteraceae bacterium]